MKFDVIRRLMLSSLLLAPLAAAAQSAPAAGANAGTGQGEVRRIAKEQNKITLRHGEIRALDMPAMTMVFTVRDADLLDKVKVGDKVQFSVEKTPEGVFLVTALQPAP
jgi:Cu(I)/Ag(I) efflux system protein CusF